MAELQRLIEKDLRETHNEFAQIREILEDLERKVDAARRRADEAEAERDALAQAMWTARAILGFDNDSAPTPHGYVAGMGRQGFREAFLEDMRQQRKDYDDALAEIPDAP